MATTRRAFLARSLMGVAGGLALPTFISPRAWAAEIPPNRHIQIGQIGCGRIAQNDMAGVLWNDDARYVAVCDVDSNRLELARKRVIDHYTSKEEKDVECATFRDYREMLARPDIDAVVISTPDHQHALPVAEAILAGKDVYVQKPLTLTMAEARLVKRLAVARKAILQVGSQQRSDTLFRRACELVRNGRIGKIHTIKIGLPTDPAGKVFPPGPVPENLDYDRWLGSTHSPSEYPYIEQRVHSQKDLNDRPGWLRVEDFCLGMITGWGSHHLDIAHWGMGTELSGPVSLTGKAEFPKEGVHTVHGPYHVEMGYANGVRIILDNSFKNGVRFEGADGWIFVTRVGSYSHAKDPKERAPLMAHDPAILKSQIGAGEIQLVKSANHYGNWLESIRSRKAPVAPADQGAHSAAACIAAWISMKLGRTVTFDPETMSFPGDDEATALCSRPQRAGYSLEALAKSAGF